MNRVIKTIAVLLLAAFALSLFSGCRFDFSDIFGDKEAETTAAPVQQPPAVQQQEPPTPEPPAQEPATPEPPTPEPPTPEPPTPEPPAPEPPTQESLVKKNGKPVFSADELSLYDVVTFGRYPQTEYGSETPIEWYVIKIDGNKVRRLSRYCLDSRQYHHSIVKRVEFENSDLYKWLNNEFKNEAFSEEERLMLSRSVTLLNQSEVMKLPKDLRGADATEYAVKVCEFNEEKSFWWLGETADNVDYVWDYNTWEYKERHYAWAMKGDGSDIWYFVVDFHHKGVRPAITIQF